MLSMVQNRVRRLQTKVLTAAKKFSSLGVFCFTLSLPCIANATSYYVDATSGSDLNSGTADTAPWKTVAKVNAKALMPGDFVLFKRGETWREQLTISSSGASGSPITYGAYGTGAKPVITGADKVGGWYLYSGNIYNASVTRSTSPTQLYVDGAFYDLAHYPNSGYLLTTATAANTTSLIDANLTLTSAQVVGATVNTRAVAWQINSPSATGYDSSTHTITLNGPTFNSSLDMKAGYGFFLSNKLWMLDAPGEWFFDNATDNLYLWTPAGDSPTSHVVEISTRPYGIFGSGKHDVTIQDLAITNADQDNVHLDNATNVTVQRLDLSGGVTGMNLANAANVLISQNRVDSPLSNGIYLVGSSGTTNNVVVGNIVNRAGNVGGPKMSNAGLFSNGSGTTIKNNSVSNSGYDGIMFLGDQSSVQGNAVDKSCTVLDDCGGIYTIPGAFTYTRNSITGNAVTNTVGNYNGTPGTMTHAHGIYLDDASHDVVISGNTTSNTDLGIYLHDGYNNTVTGNKVYGSRTYSFLIEEDWGALGSTNNNQVNNNAFESSATTPPAGYASYIESATNFGVYNYNQFCHPNSSYAVMNQNLNYSLFNWQQLSGQDLNSTDVKALCTAQAPTLTLASGTAADGSTLLNWSSSNATSCAASGAWSGAVPLSSSWPADQSGTYTLTCSGRGGSTTQSVSVTVGGSTTATTPAPTVTLAASPTSVAYGGASTLGWSSTDATSCSASGAWSGAEPVSGSQTLSNLTTGGTYTLTCTGSGGSASQSVNVSVAAPAPTLTFTASPSTVSYRGSSTLSWSAANATSCLASGGWTGTKAVSGSQYLKRLTATQTYNLSCTGSGGTTSQSATITVIR